MSEAKDSATENHESDWGLVVEWFRLERSRELTRILLIGAPLVLIGDVCAGIALSLDWLGTGWQTVILVLGIIATAAGPGYVIWKLRHLWDEDHFIALGTRGLRYEGPHDAWFVTWDEVSEVRMTDDGEVWLDLNDERTKAITGPFAGTTAAELAAKLKTVRRKALFGLYNT